MKTPIFRLFVLMLTLLGFMAAIAPASAADMSAIDKRKDVMKKVVLKNFKVIKDFVKESKGTAADVEKAAMALAAVAPKIPPLFPAGTGRPEVAAKITRANPEIWSDWDKFVASARTLGTEAATLSKVAAGGNKEAIAEQFINMGKKGCGSCHKSFRGKKVK